MTHRIQTLKSPTNCDIESENSINTDSGEENHYLIATMNETPL